VKDVRREFARPVAVRDDVRIPMADGCELAAKVWLPADAEAEPVPALLEYIPYRKSDGTAVGDSTRHAYFAGHGYASVRVDLRGSGDSDGVLLDEYLPQEQDDGVEVLAWLAAQPWCTGATGMFGISWGGFNSLQIAARRPPSLKAIITVCSTDDRYADDVHYMGGCVLTADAFSWASTMLAFNARPPDPHAVGDRWRELWLERLEGSPPFIEAWLSHQRRDAFWRHGSVCEDYSAIECAVYAVGGWADAYRNAIFRLLEGLPGPRKGLIGPWSHNYPEDGVPGPAIGFLQEALRWWDHWLKGSDNGIMEEPMLRAWMQESVEPKPFYDQRPGRWVAEPSWPPPSVEPSTVHLDFPVEQVRGAEAHGLRAGDWCPYGGPEELPPDQRPEDGLALCCDGEPLEDALEILGFPEVELTLASDRPSALVAVRLCDVAPDGASTLVTRGLLNLTHRGSHEQPTALVPGERYDIRVRLSSIAHAFLPGHRLRVAVSPSYWFWAWPSPEPVTLTISGARLRLPVRPPQARDAELAPFGPPEGAAPLDADVLRAKESGCSVRHDLCEGRRELAFRQDYGGRRRLVASGIEFENVGWDVYTLVDGSPLSASVRCERTSSLGRNGWRVRVETVSTCTADATAFYLTNAIDAYEGDVRVWTRMSTGAVPRSLV
jgi:putative CocE/NonD family hydrolase